MATQSFPHVYRAQASGTPSGAVDVRAPELPAIVTWPPPEFDGPRGEWSPETLLVAAVADCFVLSFRAVARASRLEWKALDVDVQGVLERIEGVTRFTKFIVAPRLVLAEEADASRAPAILDKAKRTCLVSNSLSGACELVRPADAATPAVAAA